MNDIKIYTADQYNTDNEELQDIRTGGILILWELRVG